MVAWCRVGILLAASPAALALAGCTPEEAAPYGKLLFGLMIAFFVGAPVAFYRAWRRRMKP